MSNMASDAKACFSSKVEYRAVIWYLYLKGKTGKEIHGELAGLGGSLGCAVGLETRRSRVQPPPRSATFFRGD